MSSSAQGFRKATLAEFHAMLAASSSERLAAQIRRFMSFDHWIAFDAAVHHGDLELAGSLQAPAYCTLIDGQLDVAGNLDLRNPGIEEGGLFIVLGNVTCNRLIGEYGKCVFIDGDVEAREAIITGFHDSSLVVCGGLSTRLFIGCDIAAEVGDGAVMDFGVGTCVPLGGFEVSGHKVAPLNDEAATARAVWPEPKQEGYLFDAEQFVARIDAGLPILR
ncbi:MAG: hypothetical protein JNM89_07415 [Hyphomicrobiaceae bacterium]|nr:hypothetical protein [Hyphomicrobiaceae bacterium]